MGVKYAKSKIHIVHSATENIAIVEIHNNL